jgi:NADH-quinone oxidoreductase subunit H
MSVSILGLIATIALAWVVGLLYMGLDRKITARVQNRYGPPVHQQFIDVVKLFRKKTAISHGTMFHLGPVLAITGSVSTLLFIPVLNGSKFWGGLSFQGDLILIIYLMVFGSLGMALAVGESANPNGIIGVSRGLTQMLGFELPFLLAVITLMIQNGTTSLVELTQSQAGGHWNLFYSPLASVAAFLALLGMMGHQPFDVPIAPAEIASGPMSEFGGKYLGMMMSSRSIFTFAKLTLFADLFLGGSGNLVSLVAKTFAIFLWPVVVGLIYPRFRTEQSVRFFWSWPAAIGLLGLILAVW